MFKMRLRTNWSRRILRANCCRVIRSGTTDHLLEVIAKTGNDGYTRPEQLWNLGPPFRFRSSQVFLKLPAKDSNLRLLIQSRHCIKLKSPTKGSNSRSLARTTVGSTRTLHQLEDMRFEDAAPLSTGAPDNFDHLFDHLSVRVHGVRCGSSELHQQRNRLSTGVYRGSRVSNETYVS
jgi:hypothetical protein